MLLLIIGTGLYLSIGLRGITFVKIPYGFAELFRGRGTGTASGISPFNALMTSLSATVGTGNIVGVATAITLGGPGAIFWMWIVAIVGTATKFSEAVLAVHFREKNAAGRYVGGPMYYISKGIGVKMPVTAKYLAGFFAFMGGITGLASGNMIQAHSVADALHQNFGIHTYITAVLIFVCVGAVLLGGIKSISNVAGKLVPFMTISYIGSALFVILVNFDQIPHAFYLIFSDAFEPLSAAGGILGGLIALFGSGAVRFGASRGVLSNEAGMGSAPIAHAAAETEDPVQQGVVAMLGTVIDTLIICTMTALAIIVSGVWTSNEIGVTLTSMAFDSAMPGIGSFIITIALPVFGFTTLLGWSYYGERCWAYALGEKSVIPFRIAWVAVATISTSLKLDFVWLMAEFTTAMMAIPNLIALLLLGPVVFRLSKQYFENEKSLSAG
ncbi:MAG: sodium:alanine symporter family protein [Pseudomonadota bacterium]